MPILILIAKTLAVAFGEKLATELVCQVSKDCPDTVDRIAGNAKAKQDPAKRPAPPAEKTAV